MRLLASLLFAIRGLCLKHAGLSSQILRQQHRRLALPDAGLELGAWNFIKVPGIYSFSTVYSYVQILEDIE